MYLHTKPDPAKAHVECVLVLGQTGVGKSSVTNMALGVPDGAEGAARVSNDVCPCTTRPTSYSVTLATGQCYQVWDMHGMDEGVDAIAEEILRDCTKSAPPILILCIDAAKINVASHWQQLQTVYMEYCEGSAIPIVIVTQMPANATGWEIRCHTQLRHLDLRGLNAVDIPLLTVRRYRSTSSIEYFEDSKAVRDLIIELVKR